MEKKEKLLMVLAIVLSVIAVAFWTINLTAKEDVVNEDNTTNTPTPNPSNGVGIDVSGGPGSSDFDIAPSFSENTMFAFEKVSETEFNIVLKGDTQDVSSAELVVKYNPAEVEVTELMDGSLFDLYISAERINEEKGVLKLAGAFTGEVPPVKTEGVFATVKYNKLVTTPSKISIVEWADGVTEYSRLVTASGTNLVISSTEDVL